MKFILLSIGKTTRKYLEEGIAEYEKRIKKYLPFGIEVLKPPKIRRNTSSSLIKEEEGKAILKYTGENDFIILLDEKGTEYSSVEFSNFLQEQMSSSWKNIVFITGGAYGFSDEIYKKANKKISLSKMTFSHQLVRLIFAEQLYRALTIWKGEPYHHE
ncbi:MAG: 23S rRNA (pseudouridine(1915)-N(3))-methyltransferase RlmH [bacterium]